MAQIYIILEPGLFQNKMLYVTVSSVKIFLHVILKLFWLKWNANCILHLNNFDLEDKYPQVTFQPFGQQNFFFFFFSMQLSNKCSH